MTVWRRCGLCILAILMLPCNSLALNYWDKSILKRDIWLTFSFWNMYSKYRSYPQIMPQWQELSRVNNAIGALMINVVDDDNVQTGMCLPDHLVYQQDLGHLVGPLHPGIEKDVLTIYSLSWRAQSVFKVYRVNCYPVCTSQFCVSHNQLLDTYLVTLLTIASTCSSRARSSLGLTDIY